MENKQRVRLPVRDRGARLRQGRGHHSVSVHCEKARQESHGRKFFAKVSRLAYLANLTVSERLAAKRAPQVHKDLIRVVAGGERRHQAILQPMQSLQLAEDFPEVYRQYRLLHHKFDVLLHALHNLRGL